MIGKYYTPELSEFYIGFEFYEENIGGDLVQKTIGSVSMLLKINKELNEFKDEEDEEQPIRVKYLDREDIESLGFIDSDWIVPKAGGSWRIIVRNFDLPCERIVTVLTKNHVRDGSGDFKELPMLYRAKIKNKSELEKILKQIGYE